MTTYVVTASDNYLNLLKNLVVAGDTVQFRDTAGPFAPALAVGNNGYFDVPVRLTLMKYPGDSPVLTHGGTDKKAIIWVTTGAGGTTIDGLGIIGTYALGGGDHTSQAGVFCNNTVGDVTLRNLTITGWDHCGIKAATTGALLVELCHIGAGGYGATLDHGMYFPGEGLGGSVIARHSEIHNAISCGIQLYNSIDNALIYGIVAQHCNTGILLTGNGHRVYSCTLADNAKGLTLFMGTPTNLDVRNVIAWNNSALDFNAEGGATPVTSTFNHNCYSSCNSALMQGVGDITTDPCFVGPFTDPATAWRGYRIDCPKGRPTIRDIGVPVTGVTELLDPRQLVLATKAVGTLWSMGPWDYN